MTWWHAIVIFVAGLWAGTINTVVGSGTLVTFPTLIALGYSPITATTSNAIGLTPGSISGVVGYRHELVGTWRRLIPYVVLSTIGAILGAILLLLLPKDAFETIVPVLVGLAVVLVIVQPLISRRLIKRRERKEVSSNGHGPLLMLLVFVIGIYGGYFTAAQGVMLMAVLGILLSESLQRLNAVKNVLTAATNIVATVVYAVVAPINWQVVALLAVSSTIGGTLGAKIGRKLSPLLLRGVIIAVGLAAVVHLLVKN